MFWECNQSAWINAIAQSRWRATTESSRWCCFFFPWNYSSRRLKLELSWRPANHTRLACFCPADTDRLRPGSVCGTRSATLSAQSHPPNIFDSYTYSTELRSVQVESRRRLAEFVSCHKYTRTHLSASEVDSIGAKWHARMSAFKQSTRRIIMSDMQVNASRARFYFKLYSAIFPWS